jgi:hypothetical protein
LLLADVSRCMPVRRIHYLAVAFAVLLPFAGCLGSPSSGPNAPPGNESFTVEVTGNTSQSVYVAVHLYTEPPESVTLEYANETTREFQVPTEQGLVAGDTPDGLRSVATPGDDGGVYFEGPPAFTASALEIAEMPTAIYVVRVDGSDQVAAWGIVSCNGHVDRLVLDAVGANVTAGGIACSN